MKPTTEPQTSLMLSVVCQILDWDTHKNLCKSINDVKPGKGYRRGLFFPAEDEHPHFVWVEVQTVGCPNDRYEKFDNRIYFGDGDKAVSCSTRNIIQARAMNRARDESLNIYCMDDNTTQPPNRAISKFTRAGVCSICFRGPYLVMHFRGKSPSLEHYQDLDMRDVRHAADYFSTFNRANDRGLLDVRVLATTIVCPAHRDTGLPNHVQRVVNGADPIFVMQGSGIANLLGIPLLLRASEYDDSERMQLQGSNAARLLVEDARRLMRDVSSRTKGNQISEKGQAARD